MRWLSRSIQDRIERVAELDYDIYEARQTLAQMEVDTLGGRAPGDQGRAGRGAASGDAGQYGLDLARLACREAVKLSRE